MRDNRNFNGFSLLSTLKTGFLVPDLVVELNFSHSEKIGQPYGYQKASKANHGPSDSSGD